METLICIFFAVCEYRKFNVGKTSPQPDNLPMTIRFIQQNTYNILQYNGSVNCTVQEGHKVHIYQSVQTSCKGN